jgi:hypothetical protein
VSDWNLGRVFRVAVAAVVSYYSSNWGYLASQIAREDANANASRQRRRAVQQYNEQVKDRLEMFEPMADAPRSLVLGRVRYVEGVRRRWTSGTNEEKLTMIVSFAGHEIDAFESWYIDDHPVTLDGDGWVQEEPWCKTIHEQHSVTGTLNGSGGATLTLDQAPLGGYPVFATVTVGSGDNMQQSTATVSVSGTTATVSGGVASASVTVGYTAHPALSRNREPKRRQRPCIGVPRQDHGNRQVHGHRPSGGRSRL